MSDDLKERLRANHLDECYEAIDCIEALTAERDALVDAVRMLLDCPHIADRDTDPEWAEPDTEAAIYAASAALCAIDPAAIAAKLKGDGDDR